MKKALLISNVTNKYTNFIIPSIEVLQDLGYEVHTCANYSNFVDDKTKYNVTMHHIDFIRNPFKLGNIKAYKQLLKLMKEERFDLVHCNTPIGGLLGRICARRTKVPKVIYTAHGFHFYKGAPLINRILYKLVEKWLAHDTDILVTMNTEDYEAAKKFKLRKNGKTGFVHGVGINTDTEEMNENEKKLLKDQLNLKEDDIVCMAVGELNRNKNYEAIVKTVKQVNNPKVHLLVCGVGKDEECLKNLVKELNLENQVEFLGYRKDVPQLLKIADIFIQMSYREGLSRSIMEAMAARTSMHCFKNKRKCRFDYKCRRRIFVQSR